MRKETLILISAGILLCMLVLIYVQVGSGRQHGPPEQPGVQSAAEVYRNFQYGYKFTLPNGWRIATALMAASNPTSALQTADFVAITQLSPAEELSIAKQVEQLNPDHNIVSMQAVLTGSTFTVTPVTMDLGLEFASRLSAKYFRNTTIPAAKNVRADTIEAGMSVARYELPSPNSPDVDIETVFVPFTGSLLLDSYGAPVRGFIIRTNHDRAFSESAFTNFYKSFKYLR
jgi:hypothetical protein